MGEVSDLIASTSSPADLAVVLVAGTTGLVIDAGLGLVGLPSPALTAFAFASGALGLKKSGEAYWGAMRARRERGLGPRERGERLLALFSVDSVSEGPPSVEAQEALNTLANNLFLHKEGIINDDDLSAELDKALTEYRSQGSPGFRYEVRSSQPPQLLD